MRCFHYITCTYAFTETKKCEAFLGVAECQDGKEELKKSDDLQIKHISEGHSYSPLYILFAFLKYKKFFCLFGSTISWNLELLVKTRSKSQICLT